MCQDLGREEGKVLSEPKQACCGWKGECLQEWLGETELEKQAKAGPSRALRVLSRLQIYLEGLFSSEGVKKGKERFGLAFHFKKVSKSCFFKSPSPGFWLERL